MKIALLSFTDTGGGAFKSAYNSYKSLSALKDVNVTLFVRNKKLKDTKIKLVGFQIINTFKNYLIVGFVKLFRLKNFSLNIFPTNFSNFINKSNFDIVNLHWINGESISIKDINNIKKPLFVTLHDEWFILGGFHYRNSKNFFLDRYLKKKKKILENKKIYFICPSKWIEKRLKKNTIYKNFETKVIPYCVSSNFSDKSNYQKIKKNNNLLFSNPGYSNDPRKGYDLFFKSIDLIKKKLKIVILGNINSIPKNELPKQHSYKFINFIEDEKKLKNIILKSQVVCIPSRQDNLPNFAIESLMCKRPIITFDIGGMRDIVQHNKTGYVARPFSSVDFSNGIIKVMNNLKFFESNIHKSAYLKKFTKKKHANSLLNFFKKSLV